MHLYARRFDAVFYIVLGQDRDKWPAVVNRGIILTS